MAAPASILPCENIHFIICIDICSCSIIMCVLYIHSITYVATICIIIVMCVLCVSVYTSWDEELIDLAQTWTPKENSTVYTQTL